MLHRLVNFSGLSGNCEAPVLVLNNKKSTKHSKTHRRTCNFLLLASANNADINLVKLVFVIFETFF